MNLLLLFIIIIIHYTRTCIYNSRTFSSGTELDFICVIIHVQQQSLSLPVFEIYGRTGALLFHTSFT